MPILVVRGVCAFLLPGGRFSLGLCFYFMLISSILMTIAGKVVLFEVRNIHVAPCTTGHAVTDILTNLYSP